MSPEEVTGYLHTTMPVAQAMRIRVEALDIEGGCVELSAPLAPNLNHRDTAFGGSLSTLGILAGWTLLHVRLHGLEPRVRVVIQESQTRYIRPVDSDFRAVCALRPSDGWDNFMHALRRRGKARVSLRSDLVFGGRVGATHDGVYVAVSDGVTEPG